MPLEPVYNESGEIVGYEFVGEDLPQQEQSRPNLGMHTQTQASEPTFLGETVRAIGGGVRDAAEETIQTLDYLGSSAVSLTGLEIAEEGFIDPNFLPEVSENQTTAGSMARGVVQFVAGFGAAGKALKAAGMGTKFLKGQGTGTRIAQGALRGAVADFTVFDAHEARLSDFLREHAGLNDPVTAYLSSDEDDSIAEGKLKNALEGLGIGLAVDGFVSLMRGFKRSREIARTDGQEAAATEMNRVASEEAAPTLPREDQNLGQTADEPELSNPFAREEEAPTDLTGSVSEADRIEAATGVRGAEREIPAVNAEAVREALDENRLAKMVADRGVNVDFTEAAPGKLFNHDTMGGAKSTLEVMNVVAGQIRESRLPKSKSFEKISAAAKKTLADATGSDVADLEAAIAAKAKDSEQVTEMFIAGKMVMQDLGREIFNLSVKIDEAAIAGRNSLAEEARLLRYINRMGELEANLKTIQTTGAQTTAAGRIRTRDALSGERLADSDLIEQIRSQVTSKGGSKSVQRVAQKIRGLAGGAKDLPGIGAIGRETRKPGAIDIHNEYWINSILSGPKTHLLNVMSNAAHTVLLPAEQMVGGALRQDRSAMRQGARMFAGMSSAIKDSFRFAGTAFWRGENILDPQAAIREGEFTQTGAISRQGLGLKEGPMGNLADMVGKVVRLPSRFLLSGDEFFKQLNYRAATYAKVMDEAGELVDSGQLRQADVASWVTQRVEDTIEKGTGRGLGESGIAHAREVTFTRELEAGTLGRTIQDAVNKHPYARILLPFVRTPTNIIRSIFQRTPLLGRLERQMKADLESPDPIRRAVASGKMATGYALWSGAIVLAAEGRITGGGPSDPRLRSRLMETGWRPYSFVLGDEETGVRYVEFRRMDPFATFFGMAADFADMGGQMDEAEAGDMARMMVTAVANNLVSKTYLTGLIDAIKALVMPDWYAESWFYNQAASYTPFSAGTRTVRQQTDPVLREVKTLMDAYRNTIPGLSESVPARVSWITGDPFIYPKGFGADTMSPVGEALAAANPIIQSDAKGNIVLDELARLQHGFTAPTREIRGIEMSGAQYERLLSLHGTITIGRFTLSQRLERLIQTRRYQEAAELRLDPDEYRLKLVREVIADYRDAARRALLREDQQLAESVQTAAEQNGLRLRGRFSSLDSLVAN